MIDESRHQRLEGSQHLYLPEKVVTYHLATSELEAGLEVAAPVPS